MTRLSPPLPLVAVLSLLSGCGPDAPEAPLGGLSRWSGAGGENVPPSAGARA